MDEEQQKVVALMQELKEDYGVCEKHIEDGNYKIYDNEDADEAYTDAIDDFIDDVILFQMGDKLQRFFCRDLYMSEFKRDSCRANMLASYDGKELEQEVMGTNYYIFKVN